MEALTAVNFRSYSPLLPTKCYAIWQFSIGAHSVEPNAHIQSTETNVPLGMDGQEIFFGSSSLDNQEGPLGFKFCYLNY
jgi:hypothetical protein